MALHVELADALDAQTQEIWSTLEATAHPSYFGSWGWIETWLTNLPRSDLPQLAVVRDDSDIVGAFFLGRHRMMRHHLVPIRAAYLNGTGVARYDELCVEHNAALLAPMAVLPLARLVELLPHDWDELVLGWVDRATFADLDVPRGYRVRIDRELPAPYVDLQRVRAAGDYLALLSSNTRAQLRRASRHVGACELEVADSVSTALEIYSELVSLHGATWRERGEAGAFADPWFESFHRHLIERRFDRGEIQLARLRAGSQTIGCLYNLIANGRVLFYQSGFAHFDDPAIKPGFLCHAAAITRCASAGHAVYDFLVGDSRYKTSLATDATPLVRMRVQRMRLRFAIEDQVTQWRHALVDRRA